LGVVAGVVVVALASVVSLALWRGPLVPVFCLMHFGFVVGGIVVAAGGGGGGLHSGW
jgi:hypothetical protein